MASEPRIDEPTSLDHHDSSPTIQSKDELDEQNHSVSVKRSLALIKTNFVVTLGKMQETLQTESDPAFAEAGEKLHHALSETQNEFIQTGDSNKLIHTVKEDVKKSEPILKNSPVWKQILLDILNAVILIGTLGLSYMVKGRVRLFTAQPQESEIDEAKSMKLSLQETQCNPGGSKP